MNTLDATQIVRQAAGPAIATDARFRILALNRAATELLGFGLRRARGQNLHQMLQVRDASGNRLSAEPFAFHEMVSRSEPVRSFDIEVRTSSGEPLRVAISVIVVLGQATSDNQLVYQLRPIYRRRKADEAIDRILAARADPEADPLRLRGSQPTARDLGLTHRQIEVLRLMARGVSAKEMASTLGISVHTVRSHVQRILRTLDAHSQLEAAAVAFRERLI